MAAPGLDEQLLLRVPPALAARLRRILAEDPSAVADTLDLRWDETGRQGTLRVGVDSFDCKACEWAPPRSRWRPDSRTPEAAGPAHQGRDVEEPRRGGRGEERGRWPGGLLRAQTLALLTNPAGGARRSTGRLPARQEERAGAPG